MKDELLFDFAVNMPRVFVSGNTIILDNVKKLVLPRIFPGSWPTLKSM